MKDMFNKRQRFSLRKYSFGVASVLLGIAIFSNKQVASADEATVPATSTAPGIATTSVGDPTSAVTETSTVASTATSTTTPATTSEAASTATTSEVASTVATSTVAPASEATTSTAASTVNSTASAEASITTQASASSTTDSTAAATPSSPTIGYAVNPVATPTTSSMPRLQGYTGVAGTTTTLASNAQIGSNGEAITANPNIVTTMPGDSELTDRSQFGKNPDPALQGIDPVIGTPNKAGNAIQPYILTGANADFDPHDVTKRVAEIWAIRDASGTVDAQYAVFVLDINTRKYELRVYNNAKQLVSTTVVNNEEGQEARIQLAGSSTSPDIDQAYVALRSNGNGYDAIYNGTDGWIAQGRPADQSGVRLVYTASVMSQVGSSYRTVDPAGAAAGQSYTTVTQSLLGGAVINVNYFDEDTKQQLRPSNQFIGAANDTYTTSAATDSELDAQFQDKGYELDTSKLPKHANGTIDWNYFGGKGSVIVRDVTNLGYDLRVRLTVVDDEGNVRIEAWNKADGTKLPIGGYRTATSGTGTLDYATQDGTDFTEPRTYVSEKIKPGGAAGASSSAQWGQVVFLIGQKDSSGTPQFFGTHDGRNYGIGQLSYWGNGWVEPVSDITYWYTRPKGDVTVEYYIEGTNTKIATDQKAADQVSVKEPYDATTTRLRPQTITYNGQTYRLVTTNDGSAVLKSGSATATGTVEKTPQTVQYQYRLVVKQKADITVVAVDANGNPMSVARKSGLTTTPITDGVLEVSNVLEGDAGDSIQNQALADNFNYQSIIARYQALGYEVVPGSYTGTGTIASKGTMAEYNGSQTFDNDDNVDQHYVIKLTPVIVPVTPDQPVTPGGNVPNVPGNPTYPTPNTPSTPGTPDPTDPTTMRGTINRVVEYYVTDADGSNERRVGSENTAITDKTDTLRFVKTGTINLVTGEVEFNTNWTPQDGTRFDNYTSPTWAGHTVDKVVAGEHTGITAPGAQIVDKVVYRPTTTPTPTPTIQQADITFVAVDENGNAMTVGRDKAGNQGVALVNGVLEMAVDPTDNNNIFEGQAGNLVGYDPTDIIKAYQKVGYKVVPGDFNGMVAYSQTGSSFDDVAGNVQHFVIKLTPIIVPYTPDKPVKPGEDVPDVPTDPNNPNPETPTYPTPNDPRTENRNNELEGTRKRTVVYYVVNADGSNKRLAVSENPALTDKVDTLRFQKSGTVNLVTGETTWQNDWTAVDGTKFDNYASPAWSGHSVDKVVAGEHTGITAPGADIVDEVVYTPTNTTPVIPTVQKGSVTVEYVTEDGTPLQVRTDVERDVNVGTAYSTREKRFVGYTFVRMGAGSAAATGTVALGEQHVIYVYRANPAVQRADITIVAVDANGNALTSGRKSGTTPEAITDGVLEESSTLRGQAGDSVQTQATADNFDYQALIKKYQKLGYKVVAGSYTGTGSIANKGTMTEYTGTQTFDNIPGNIQHFVIKLTPIIVPVTPEQPVTPGDDVPNVPTDPSNPTPETPTYPTPETPTNPNDPDPTKPATMTGTANRVVKYYIVDADGSNKRPAPIADATQVLNFRKEGQINLATGAYSYPSNWTAVDGTEFTTVVSPALTGYTADKATAGYFTGITAPGMDRADEVIYRPVAVATVQQADIKFVAVDADGNPLTKGRTKDGQQGVALTDGLLEMATNTDGKTTFEGQAGETLGYNPEDVIKAYQKVGYKVVPGDFQGIPGYSQTGSTFDNVDGNVQHFVIKLTPIIVPVTPEQPVTPGGEVPNVPTDPNNPTPETPTYPTPETPSNPNDPDPTKPATMTGESNRVIKYYIREADGSLTPAPIADNTYTLTYRKEGQINLVTGDYSYPATWTAEKGTEFPLVVTPTLTGYTPDKVAAGHFAGITEPGMDKEDVVIFTKKPDTPVTPAVKQKADVTYIAIDADGNRMTVGRDGVALDNGVLEVSGTLEGDNGAKIDYSTEASIKKYLKQGYKLVSSDYPTDPRFDNDTTVDQHYFVYLTPNIVPFEPNKPVEPGKEIPGLPEDPTYPDPKDPDAKDPNRLKETVKRTVTYWTEDKDGNNKTRIAESDIATKEDTLYFRRTGTINVVTGEVVMNGWTLTDASYDKATTDETGSFSNYTSPVHTGYILKSDQYREAGAHTDVKATDGDYADEVIYIPIAKYVPKWPVNDVPNDPWKDVPYTNDPQDPGKIVPPTSPEQPPIPYVPGYTPKDPGTNTPLKPVDPTDPSKGYIPPVPNTPTEDTEIPYERDGKVIVKYVTEDGTPLKDDRVDTPDSPVGTDYNTNEPGENPSTITKDGKTYELVRVDGNETGKVTPGTTVVTYIYREVVTPTPVTPKGDVVVEYRDEKGNVLKDPRIDTPESPVGTDYNTNEPGENPTTITKDGVTYELVRVDGNESGKVVEGRTTVVYVYRPVEKPEVPEKPETPEQPVTPPTTPEVPQTPEKPATPTTYTPANPTPVKPATPAKELPETGDSSNAAAVAGVGILGSLLAGLGLSRKKKED